MQFCLMTPAVRKGKHCDEMEVVKTELPKL